MASAANAGLTETGSRALSQSRKQHSDKPVEMRTSIDAASASLPCSPSSAVAAKMQQAKATAHGGPTSQAEARCYREARLAMQRGAGSSNVCDKARERVGASSPPLTWDIPPRSAAWPRSG